MNGIFTAFKRLFIWLGVIAEKATENDACNEAIVERELRDQKVRADKAAYANGQLKSQIILLKDQVKRQANKKMEVQMLLDQAVKTNDEANGSNYAEELATVEGDLKDNMEQLKQLEDSYQQNLSIIAESIRQIEKAQRDFKQLKTKVAISRNMEGLANMMKSSIAELQGTLGGESAAAMERMRSTAAQGQGQVDSTLDLAREMGNNIRNQQEAKKARGKALFAAYKEKNAAQVQTAPAVETTTPERTKVSVAA